jgi:NAD+ synthase (glutamine-hydrolysing)
MKVSIVQMNPTIGDFRGNSNEILEGIRHAREQGAQSVLFSECAITGYPAEDYLLLPGFIDEAEKTLQEIIPHTEGICAIIGLPTRSEGVGEKKLYNSAAIVVNGQLLGYHHKVLLPTYDVFDERRYFEPGKELRVWEIFGKRVAITICEDLWEGCPVLKEASYHKNILQTLKAGHPDLFLNLSASPYYKGKVATRIGLCQRAVKELHVPVILCNQFGGNDCLIFDGHSIVMDKEGQLQLLGKGCAFDQLLYDMDAPSKKYDYIFNPNEEIYQALVVGLRDYFHKSGLQKACLGLSGGIDSALVACIAVDALGKDNVLGVLMPSRYSSAGSLTDAYELAKNLGIATKEISIESAFEAYLQTLAPHFQGKDADITEENLQARIRGMLLMALSNKHGYTLLATGNKSELAMGYCTLYGDMSGGIAPIGDITKTEIYALARWLNRDGTVIPENTILKPPSAELKPNQKDSDTLPEYAILDNILQAHVEGYHSAEQIVRAYGYPADLVNRVIKTIHKNEYKRRQGAPALKISPKAFSYGRRFPIVQRHL